MISCSEKVNILTAIMLGRADVLNDEGYSNILPSINFTLKDAKLFSDILHLLGFVTLNKEEYLDALWIASNTLGYIFLDFVHPVTKERYFGWYYTSENTTNVVA